jgi:molybdopterin converting factor small subunit
LAERKKVLANLRETQKTLESKKEELEQAKIKELEEKLANARRKYGDMKVHLVINCVL